MCLKPAKRETVSSRDYYVSAGMKVSIIKPVSRILIHGKAKKDPLSKSFNKNSSIIVLTETFQLSSVR